MEKITAYYNQQSYEYSEDNWERESTVENAQDVFEFMRECHISDAYNRNDYPLCSFWGRWVDFYKQEYEICNLGHQHLGQKTKIDPPSFYTEGKELYERWEERINRTIPHLRTAQKKHLKELKDKKLFEELKKNYG